MDMRHNKETIEKAKTLYESGYSKYKIEKLLKLKKGTARYWAKKNFSVNEKIENLEWLGDDKEVKVEEIMNSEELRKAYSYVFAIYLSDGYLAELKSRPGVYRMRFFNDVKYPINSEEWRTELHKLFPNHVVSRTKPSDRNIWLISLYGRRIPVLFPHVGKGMKHERKLNIQDWQKDIIEKEPEKFIKGCIESDGSIYEQTVGKYKYVRYNFSNNSEEIASLLILALSKVGIEKKLYFHPTKKSFFVQNFDKKETEILKKIIPTKH